MLPLSELEREVEKIKAQVNKWIKDASGSVVVFSKTTCPFSKNVKELLDKLHVGYKTIDLDKVAHGATLQVRYSVVMEFFRTVCRSGVD